VYDEQELPATGSSLQIAMPAANEPVPSEPVPAAAGAGAAAPVPACVAADVADPCQALPRLAAAPALDGALECGLTLHPLSEALPSVQYAAAWSDSGLYVYMEVHGASSARAVQEPLYCSDSVEIFVDGDGLPGTDGAYNAPGTMQFLVAAPSGGDMATGRFLAGAAQGPWISSSLSVAPLADGYAVETLIVGADLGLWSWQPSERLGFNLAVNIAGAAEPRGAPCTTQIGQSVLRVTEPRVACDGKPWCDTRSFCWPTLVP
jgi:hypothetical protein